LYFPPSFFIRLFFGAVTLETSCLAPLFFGWAFYGFSSRGMSLMLTPLRLDFFLDTFSADAARVNALPSVPFWKHFGVFSFPCVFPRNEFPFLMDFSC